MSSFTGKRLTKNAVCTGEKLRMSRATEVPLGNAKDAASLARGSAAKAVDLLVQWLSPW